jgi:two-component system response regulator AlgR
MSAGTTNRGLNVLIVDDEAPARERLRSLLGELPDIHIVGEAATGEEAVALAQSSSSDVLLLDVRMPGMDGLEAARHLSRLNAPPAVIFTTAYDEYAVNAFDAHAIGYLLKPIRKEKLAAALARAAQLSRPQLDRLTDARPQEARTHVAARHRDSLKLIPIEEVMCFLADQKYTTVRHARGEHLIDESLRTLEEELGSSFVRIHRNALVSIKYLEAIERNDEGQYFVRLRGSEEPLPVSRRMAGELRERFRI